VPPGTPTSTATSVQSIQNPAAGGSARGRTPDPRPAVGWIRRLWSYCRLHPRATWLAGSAALVGVGLGALTPLLSGAAVDRATTGRTAGLGLVIGALVVLSVIRFVSSFVRRWAGGRLSLDVQHDLRQDVFAALARLDGAAQDALRTGQVVSRATSDLQMVQGLLAIVPLSAGQVVLFVASLAIMIALSPLLTLTALLTIPAVYLLTRATRTTLFPATWAAQQSAAEVAEIVEEDVTGVRVVKGFGQEDREVGRLRAGAARLYADRMRAVRLTARLNPGLVATTSIGQVGVLALGGYLALHGSISIGTFLSFYLYLSQLVAPTRTLSFLLILGQQARASVERVMEIIDSKAAITDPVGEAMPVPSGPLDVRLAGVHFGYTHDEPVLDDFSLHVAAGSTVALVGASGSGKSTISLLLPRFYEGQAGRISVGGVDIRTVRLAELRRTVGVVFEEAFLFSDTIAANIGYGRPDATRADVEAAARAAEAQDFIEALPDGYDTVIGERGLTLSGGQRQRLALARAMITDPRVLILDDATSAVDPATEAAIHGTLHRLTADRTTILIAHRRSTLTLADTVAMVAAGRVLDVGSHEELLARCLPYRELLGGNGEEIDSGQLADIAMDADLPQHNGVTQALWPGTPPDAATGATDGPDRPSTGGRGNGGRPTARTVVASGAGGGAGMGGGMGGMLGSLPATPELLARVDALPPATDPPPPELQENLIVQRSARGDGKAGRAAASGSVNGGAPPPLLGRLSVRRTLRPVRALLITSLVLITLDALAGLALPVLIKHGIDHGVSKGVIGVVWIASAISLVIVLADYLIQRWQLIVTGKAGESVLFGLRIREFAHLQRLGLDYYEREMAGRIMTRMTTDVDALSTFLQTGLVTSVVSLATFSGIAVTLLFMNPGLALLAFTVLPPLAIATFFFRRYSTKAYNDAREKVGIVNSDLQENVSGMRITQALGRQETNAAGFAARSDDYRKSRMRAQTAISLYFPFTALLSELAAALVLAVGAERVVSGAVTAGTLLAFVLYLDSFFAPIQQLSQIFDGYQQATVGLSRIGDLLSTPTSTPPAAHPIPAPPLDGTVSAVAVGFRYSSAQPGAAAALDGVTLDISPGETIAVVGPTGAGKSTLVKIIARYYDVTSGAVLIDGVDIRSFDLGSYRRRLGVVPQEPHLFTGTVRDNIAYGKPDAPDSAVEAAARAVGAIDVIARLRGGFWHEVQERGRNLSAGQRQLISLARAELVQPELLLLDEATAALDPAAETAVLAATDRLAGGRTTIVVAHRLSTASRADRIVVMDRGRVAEIGTHRDLLEAGGVYSRLYAREP